MKNLEPKDFIPLNIFGDSGNAVTQAYPIQTDLVYAKKNHPDNHFPDLYHPDAKLLWVHKDILPVILLTSLICEQRYGWNLVAHDCLRPVEAQEKMAKYGYPPELVMTPGMGAHPRAMSIDFLPVGVDMGTPYDFFAKDLNDNPAARNATHFPGRSAEEAVLISERRANFEKAVREASAAFGHDIYPLAEEWWDFRFKKEGKLPGSTYWGDYAPVSEAKLPGYMRLVGKPDPVPEHIESGWRASAASVNHLVREKAAEIMRSDLAVKPALAEPRL